MSAVTPANATVRALAREDLMEVVAIDAAIEARPRRRYVERRLSAALREPALHAQLAAVDADGLAGYILARVLEGEFGRSERALRLELIGVRPDARRRGIAQQLLAALCDWGRRHGIVELRTAAAWTDHRMLGWFDAMGFALAPALILESPIAGDAWQPERDDALSLERGEGPAHEVNFGAREANDFERLGRDRAHVRTMTEDDLAPIARIDRALTGRDRSLYIRSRLAEALGDGGIRVSLTARMDDTVVGYLMARADLGDFGRAEPVAVVDTVGVDPDYQRRGIGRALMAQLVANLGALRVERIETLVSLRDLPLLGFLAALGCTPAQRLPFVRGVQR
ncbi:MAG TPA: GNAT family N-acetyltransferase [Ideonella sp.]|nr:GNAT family N-acetyltransferase [Ideonella sp.]